MEQHKLPGEENVSGTALSPLESSLVLIPVKGQVASVGE